VKEQEAFWDKWKEEAFPARGNATIVISPNDSAETTSAPDGDYAPNAATPQIVVVYGRIDYSGAYAKGEPYWTEFCFRYVS
jgi:hypothetical protein